MDNLNASKFLIGSDEQDPFNYDDMHQEEIRQDLEKPTLEDDVYVVEEEKESSTTSEDESEESENEGTNDMGGSSIMILALLVGAFLFMRKK